MLYVVTAYRRVLARESLRCRSVVPDCHATGHVGLIALTKVRRDEIFQSQESPGFASKDMWLFSDNEPDIHTARTPALTLRTGK